MKRNVNRSLLIFGVLVLLIVAAAVWWFTSSKGSSGEKSNLKPEIAVSRISVTGMDSEKMDVIATMVIKNSLPVELKTNRLDFQMLVNSTKIAQSSYTKPLSVQSADSTVVKLPMQILLKPLVSSMDNIEENNSDSADYTIKTNIMVDVPVAGERSFNIDKTLRLPSFRMLKMKPGDLDVDKLGMKESKLRMVVQVENPNVYPIKMDDMKYDIKVGKEQNLHVTGDVVGLTSIPPKSSVSLPVDLKVETEKMGKFTWQALFQQDETPFVMDFTCKLIAENELLDDSKMAMTTKGTLAELKKAIKSAVQEAKEE